VWIKQGSTGVTSPNPDLHPDLHEEEEVEPGAPVRTATRALLLYSALQTKVGIQCGNLYHKFPLEIDQHSLQLSVDIRPNTSHFHPVLGGALAIPYSRCSLPYSTERQGRESTSEPISITRTTNVETYISGKVPKTK